jgi:hypothetical protein
MLHKWGSNIVASRYNSQYPLPSEALDTESEHMGLNLALPVCLSKVIGFFSLAQI